MMSPLPAKSRRRTSRVFRGFTLIELLVVVAMVGVLAALALAGYRKYILSAQSSEATSMLQNIRVAQESYKSEALSYLPVSAASDNSGLTDAQLFPRAKSALNDSKVAWESGTANSTAWATLNVRPDGPVRFGYGCIAGLPGASLPTGQLEGATDPQWANGFGGGAATDPWFIASAIGNRDGDALYAVLQTASFTTEVFVHDDTE